MAEFNWQVHSSASGQPRSTTYAAALNICLTLYPLTLDTLPLPNYCPESARGLAIAIAEAVGVPSADAAIMAGALIDAELHGTATHGISRLNIYVRRIQKGLIDPTARLSIEQRRPGVLLVDANNGIGQVQAVRTLERLTPEARKLGIACAVIRRSQHFGALSTYCNRAAAQDLILLATTSCEPAMSPTGGYDAFFGTNPIAASFPTGKDFAVKIDLSTSITARGNIITAKKEGRAIPAHWALDDEGNPTTDPAKALLGTVLTMAGHKGYALAFLVEVLSSILSGSAIGPAIGSMYKDLDRPQDVGHFFCLIDIDAFMDPSTFKQRMDQTIDAIKGGRRCDGVDEIMVPGERSARTAGRNRKQGIRFTKITLNELKSLCAELHVPFKLIPMKAD